MSDRVRQQEVGRGAAVGRAGGTLGAAGVDDWQCAHFAVALQALGEAPEAAALTRLRHLLKPPPQLPAESWPGVREAFLQHMARGARQRRSLVTKLLGLRETRASFVDGHMPLSLLLVSEFREALADLPTPLRTLFLREVEGAVPVAAPPRQLSSLA